MNYDNLFEGSLTFEEKFKDFIHGEAVHELGWTCQECLKPTYMDFYAKMLTSGKIENIDMFSEEDRYARETIFKMFDVSTALMLSTPEILTKEEIGYIGEILGELYTNFDDVVDNKKTEGTHHEKLDLMKKIVEWNYIGMYSLIDAGPGRAPNAFESYGDLLKVVSLVNQNYDELKSRGDVETVVLNAIVDIRSLNYKTSDDALNHFVSVLNGEKVDSFNVVQPGIRQLNRNTNLCEPAVKLEPIENKYTIDNTKNK